VWSVHKPLRCEDAQRTETAGDHDTTCVAGSHQKATQLCKDEQTKVITARYLSLTHMEGTCEAACSYFVRACMTVPYLPGWTEAPSKLFKPALGSPRPPAGALDGAGSNLGAKQVPPCRAMPCTSPAAPLPAEGPDG